MSERDLADSVVVVTGASTGFGRAICVEAAKRGAAVVVVNYVSSKTAAEETGHLAEKHGAKTVLVRGDVADDAQCQEIASCAQPFGRIDALFNNAGVTTFAPDHSDMDAVSLDDFMNVYRVNVGGAYQMIRAARDLLGNGARPGAVVNTASAAGVFGTGSSVPYACSKGALNTMTLSLARALAPNIRVNAICPGYMDTPWFSKALDAEAVERTRQVAIERSALKVASTANDVAGAAVFLASPSSCHITGETLLVDAGTHLGYVPRSRHPYSARPDTGDTR